LSKGCQKVDKKLPKSCQKNFKVVKKLSKFKTSREDDDGDDDEEEKEDWWLQDFVTPEAGFLVTVHPEPCLILSRAQIRALLCSSKLKFIPA
jgi:hypothetical protein